MRVAASAIASVSILVVVAALTAKDVDGLEISPRCKQSMSRFSARPFVCSRALIALAVPVFSRC